MSQRQLAFEGCTAAYISRIEAGARVPSLQILREFARRLGVSVEYLATGKDEASLPDDLLEADLAARLGDTDQAEALYLAELDQQPPPAPGRRARALAGLGELALRYGQHREAVERLEEALELDALPSDQAAAVADRLGRAYSILGQREAAIGLYERFLEQAKGNEVELDVLRFSTLLANALLDTGNTRRAEELLGDGLAIADRATDPLDRARLRWSQSRLHTLRNEPDIAARYARMAIEILEASEHTVFAAVAFQLLAHIENDRGNGEEALALIERGYPTVLASGNRYHEAMFRLERARALALLGEDDEARSVAMGAIAPLQEVSPGDAGRGYMLIASLFRSLGDNARAIELYELAAESLQGADRYLVEVYTAQGELLEAEGRQREALGLFKKALHLQIETAGR
jgi:tetratricopeptide (TPR) repeat protein